MQLIRLSGYSDLGMRKVRLDPKFAWGAICCEFLSTKFLDDSLDNSLSKIKCARSILRIGCGVWSFNLIFGICMCLQVVQNSSVFQCFHNRRRLEESNKHVIFKYNLLVKT